MAPKSVKGWAAGIGLSALAGIYSYTQFFETPEETPPQPVPQEIHVQGGALSNPFGAGSSEDVAEQESPVSNAWEAASAPEKPASLPPGVDENLLHAAQSFYKKFQLENSDYSRKFDYLDYAYNALNRNLDNAHLLGLEKYELAALIRNTALAAFQQLQYQPPADTALGRLMHVNNMRVAQDMAGLSDDGNIDRLYAEQVTAMTHESINEEKIQLALPAAKEAYEALRTLTPEDLSQIPDDELYNLRTMTNLVDYVLTSHELTYKVFERKEDRYAAVGADRDTWYKRHLELHDMLTAELYKRVNKEKPEPTSPWAEPGR